MTCYKCGNKTFKDALVPTTITFGRRALRGKLPARKCTQCGEAFIHSRDIEVWEQAVIRELVAHGPISGKALSFVRRASGLQAKELAALLDVSPSTVSRWENGKEPIGRITWIAVGDLALDRKGTTERIKALGRKWPAEVRLKAA